MLLCVLDMWARVSAQRWIAFFEQHLKPLHAHLLDEDRGDMSWPWSLGDPGSLRPASIGSAFFGFGRVLAGEIGAGANPAKQARAAADAVARLTRLWPTTANPAQAKVPVSATELARRFEQAWTDSGCLISL